MCFTTNQCDFMCVYDTMLTVLYANDIDFEAIR